MTTIRFVSSIPRSQLVVDHNNGKGRRRSLLAIARDNGVPLLFNCESGDCGACLVTIETIAGDPVPLTASEAFLLDAMGLLEDEVGVAANSANDVREEGPPRTAQRLACQYVPAEDDEIVVTYASAF